MAMLMAAGCSARGCKEDETRSSQSPSEILLLCVMHCWVVSERSFLRLSENNQCLQLQAARPASHRQMEKYPSRQPVIERNTHAHTRTEASTPTSLCSDIKQQLKTAKCSAHCHLHRCCTAGWKRRSHREYVCSGKLQKHFHGAFFF